MEELQSWSHPSMVRNEEKLVKKLLGVLLKTVTRKKRVKRTRSYGRFKRLLVEPPPRSLCPAKISGHKS